MGIPKIIYKNNIAKVNIVKKRISQTLMKFECFTPFQNQECLLLLLMWKEMHFEDPCEKQKNKSNKFGPKIIQSKYLTLL